MESLNIFTPQLITFKSIVPIIAIFTSMYGPRLSPKIPQSIKNLFNTALFRSIVIFTILYLGNRDIEMSLGIMLTFAIASMLLQNIPLSENFVNQNKTLNPCTYCGNKLKCDYDKCIQKTDRIINQYKTNYLNPN